MRLFFLLATGFVAGLFFSLSDKEVEAITHTGYPDNSIVQDYVRYAYEIIGEDIDFISTLEAENGRRDPHRQSDVPNKLGPNGREPSYGFCQILRWSSSNIKGKRVEHNDILNNELFWDDRKWQMDWCWLLYSERYRKDIQPIAGRGATMYGYNVRHAVKNRFKLNQTDDQRCIQIDITGYDYMHVDTLSGNFVGTFDLPEGVNKIFKCNNS